MGESAEPAHSEETHIDSTNIDTSWLVFSQRDGIEFAEDKYYSRLIDQIEDQKLGGYVKVGRVRANSVLNKIGLPEADLFFDNSKINNALSEHSDHLTKDILKAVPEILRDPVVITEDIRGNNINVFGNVWAGHSPVLVGIVIANDRNGRNVINKVRTVHARRDAAQKISDKSVLYLNSNQKRTRAWFQAVGTLLPYRGTKFGFVRSIAQNSQNVNQIENNLREDVPFSMREPVEERRGLVAVHNITEGKLAKALKLGGFPMPSIAITKADIGHKDFGGISLVFGNETVDPQADRRNKAYSADAWTPTFPRTEYEANRTAANRAYKRLSALEKGLDAFYADELKKIKNVTDDMLTEYGGEEGFIQRALSNYGLKAAYLEENGGHAEVVRRQEEQKSGFSEEQSKKYAAIVELIGEEALRKTPVSELYSQYADQMEKIWPGSTKLRQRFSRLLQNAAEYAGSRNSAPTYRTVTDGAATRSALDGQINAEAYESWVRELYRGIEGASGVYNGKERYTPSGNQRSFASTHYPATLEGIARAMHDAYGGKTKDVAALNNSKTLRAATAKTFRSIDEMHRNESRLQNITHEEADARMQELDGRLNALISQIQQDKTGGREQSLYDSLTQYDQIGAILKKTAAKKYSISTIRNDLAGYGYNISESTAREVKEIFDKIRDMPVNIFEAKPERAVRFDEVKYAIVPDDLNIDVRSQLEQLVADVREYPAGDEARRLELLNERKDLQFQKREYTYDELTAKPDMSVTRIDTTQNIDRNEAVRLGRENVMQYADRFDANGTPAMYVDDLGKYVYVGKKAMGHGLDRRAVRQNATIAKIGDILKNSVVVNEAIPKKAGVRNTWILLGAAYGSDNIPVYVRTIVNQSTGEVEDIASMYATLGKKSETSRVIATNASGNSLGVPAGFTISIADLLNGVKDHFSDVLSEDVAQHLGIERAESEFTANLKYQPRDEQISTREMLAGMMDTAANSADEKAWLKGYRAQLREMDHWLDAISQNKKTVRELMFKKGRTAEETTQLNKARERLKILQDKVSRVDEGLLKLENADVIRGLVNREAQRIRNEEAEKRRAGIAKVRETQRNTAVRKNIMRRAKKIDQMLRTPTDREHIPEGLKGAMLDLMDALTKNDEGAFGGSAKDMERLRRAQAEYEAMRSSDPDSDIAGQYDEDITAEKFTEKMGDMNDKFRNF